ncbi:MAG TPA: NUDIX domain-containing protein [Nevskiaceae bacterium]|nr:NUDIX domain-containing protein [Nevskiaceae bacterium]
MDENDELLDLVNVNDVVVGTIRRGDMAKLGYKSTEGFVRFAEAFILNEQSEVWVPIRGMHKSIAPGGCDFSVAEHVLSGETYEKAIERAFFEEADMTINSKDLELLGKLAPAEDKPVYEALYTYTVHGNASPKYSLEEFASANWMSMDAFEKLLTFGPPTKSALLPAFKLLQSALSR